MRILFVNFAVGGFAGDAVQMSLIARGLIDLGHKVVVAVPDGDGYFFDKSKSKSYEPIRKKLLETNGQITEIEGVPILPIHCISEKLGYYCPDAAKIGRKILNDFDIVYCINWYYHLAMTFSKIAHEKKIPFVIAAMAEFENKAHNLKNTRKKVLDYMYTKNLFKTASGFHSVGDIETNTYEKMGASKEKIFRVDHGIILEKFENAKNTGILEKLEIVTEQNPYLYNVGRIDPKKGLEVLLHAFSRIVSKYPKVLLIITGTGINEYVTKIKNLSKELQIEKSVIFTGFISEEEKIELFKSAKIHVVTSHSDVHTTTAIESMACGTPVVITKASDFPEIDEYEAGITVNTDPESVFNAVDILLQDKEKLKKCAENSKKLIQDKFLLKNKIKEYEKMFEDIINNYKI
jgi:glycosyltransferase involved in cell wall biosynthesis